MHPASTALLARWAPASQLRLLSAGGLGQGRRDEGEARHVDQHAVRRRAALCRRERRVGEAAQHCHLHHMHMHATPHSLDLWQLHMQGARCLGA